jgi:hypothetical protein
VEAMALHAAAMMAVFVDQMAQAPVVVNCAQVVPEPQWKWWVSALAPWVGPLLSGMVSIYVAWRVFGWQNKKDRKQWILDQKKAEWKELISEIAKIEVQIPVVITGIPDHKDLESIVLGILPLLRGMIFIYPSLKSSGFIAKWESYVGYVSGKFSMITNTNRSVQTGMLGGDPVTMEDRFRWRKLSTDEETKVRRDLWTYLEELRDLAYKSFEMKEKDPSLMGD